MGREVWYICVLSYGKGGLVYMCPRLWYICVARLWYICVARLWYICVARLWVSNFRFDFGTVLMV
jgi:hypothetical protein